MQSPKKCVSDPWIVTRDGQFFKCYENLEDILIVHDDEITLSADAQIFSQVTIHTDHERMNLCL